MESAIDRIYKFIDYLGVSVNEFSNKIGVSNGYLAKQRAASANIGSHIIEKIVISFPQLNLEWLIAGWGEMIKNTKVNTKIDTNIIPKKTVYSESDTLTLAAEPVADYKKPSIVQIPVVNIEAAAGSGYYNDSYLNTTDLISLPANMVSKSGMNICIKIKGDSMSPTLLDSSYLIINNIHPSDWVNIPDGHVCVVSDREGRTYVKRIKNRLNKGFIVCMSDNVDKANYPNFNLQIDEINTIWHAEWYISAKMPNINENYYSKLIQLEDNFEDLKNDMKEILKQIKPKQ